MNENTPTLPITVVQAEPARRSSRGIIGGLIAMSAALVLAIAAVGIVIASPAGTPAPVVQGSQAPQNADIVPSPVAAHPSHLLQPIVAAPVLDPVGEPADSYESDPPDALTIDFAVSNTAVLCNTQSPTSSYQHIAFTWNVTGAERVFFGVDTTDAQAEPMFVDLPHSGNSDTEFPMGYEDYTYACPEASHQYTLTAVDDQGHAVSRTVTVVNNGDTSY